MFMALQSLDDDQNVVVGDSCLSYMRIPPTDYHLESSGRAADMEAHP